MLDQEFEGHVPPPLFPPCSLFLPPCKRPKAALFERNRKHRMLLIYNIISPKHGRFFWPKSVFQPVFRNLQGGGDYE
jgi:hypothetical protein